MTSRKTQQLTALRRMENMQQISETDRPAKEPVISTPSLTAINMLTQDTCKTKNLGNKSEMAKAKRIENAIKFWSNQTSFKLSPVKDLSEKINQENMDLFPIEMRKALASGIVHTIRSTASANKRRQLQAIFSDENISIPGSVATAAVVEEGNQSTSASISFSQSAEQTQ